jgi:hypothetical protein
VAIDDTDDVGEIGVEVARELLQPGRRPRDALDVAGEVDDVGEQQRRSHNLDLEAVDRAAG